MWAMPQEDRWMHKHQQTGARPVAPTILAFAAMMLLACGGGSAPSQSQTARFPLTINQAGGTTVTISHQPRRIVSLSPTATEMLFAVGAGKQVIAVDDQSNYPANAPTTKLSGFQPNIEAIAGYTPDLVVATEDTGSLVHGMQALSIPILLEPAARTLDDSYAQIKQLGTATGHSSNADALVSQMRSQVGQFVSSLAKPSRRLRVYHELDNTYYSVTSATFIGQVYKIFGLTNIADSATAAAPDYPQLSAEFIVSSDPDLIVLADTKCCSQNLETVAARPGWGVINAVKTRQVIGVDDDVASRWGPRVIDFMRAIAPHVQQLEKAA
jgi:iron complex transport system substrate-binding protein